MQIRNKYIGSKRSQDTRVSWLIEKDPHIYMQQTQVCQENMSEGPSYNNPLNPNIFVAKYALSRLLKWSRASTLLISSWKRKR